MTVEPNESFSAFASTWKTTVLLSTDQLVVCCRHLLYINVSWQHSFLLEQSARVLERAQYEIVNGMIIICKRLRPLPSESLSLTRGGRVEDWSPFYEHSICNMQSVIWSMMMHAASVTHTCVVGRTKTSHRKDLKCTWRAKDQAHFTRDMHVRGWYHLFVKNTLWWSVGNYLEWFKKVWHPESPMKGKNISGFGI